MPTEPDSLVFNESPIVEYATNRFINVPVILQYNDTPLIEVVQVVEAGFTAQFTIFNRDGEKIARVKGARMFLTEAGNKSDLCLRHPDRMTVCELDGQTLFEIQREEAATLKTQAELFTPDGRFIRSSAGGLPDTIMCHDGKPLKIGGVTMSGNTFRNCKIGVHLKSEYSIRIGSNVA